MFNYARTKVISVTSGKGGVGKTTLISNMALSLSQMGKKVLIFDGDLGMANVDIFFGVKPKGNLLDVLKCNKEISEIITEVSKNIYLLPGGSGIFELQNLTALERRALIDSISQIPMFFDYLLIDTAPGISDNVLFLNSAAQQTAVVITPDPSSFTDSYALIKVLNQKFRENKFSIICNQVQGSQEGLHLFRKFNDVVSRFMNVNLHYLGEVPMDERLRLANQRQRLILRQEPNSDSAQAISKICAQIERKPAQETAKGGLQIFWEQVIGLA